jgi:hypothetical protein
MWNGRFSVSGFFGWLFIWLFVSPSFLSEPGFTGYEGFSGWQADV